MTVVVWDREISLPSFRERERGGLILNLGKATVGSSYSDLTAPASSFFF